MPSYPVPALPAVDDILSGLSSALAAAGGARLQHLNALSTQRSRRATRWRSGAARAWSARSGRTSTRGALRGGGDRVQPDARERRPRERPPRRRRAAAAAAAAARGDARRRSRARRSRSRAAPRERDAARPRAAARGPVRGVQGAIAAAAHVAAHSVSDAAEYALHGLCQNDPAQLSDLRDQASQMRSMSGDPPIARPAALPAAPPAPIADAFEYVIADVPVDAVSATDGDGGELRACKRVRVKGADGPTMTPARRPERRRVPRPRLGVGAADERAGRRRPAGRAAAAAQLSKLRHSFKSVVF